MSSFSAGPWLLSPAADDIIKFHVHVAETGKPETFAGVRTIDEKPPLDGTAVYVTGFGVNPVLRDREYVPCSICSGEHPKFYEGALVWAPTGHLYLVGHRCARGYFGEHRYSSMRADTRYETRFGEADAVLIVHWDKVRLLSRYIDQVRPMGHQIESARARLRENVPNMMRDLLRYARNNDQSMKVAVTPGANVPMSRTARSMLSDETFAAFQGLRLIEEKKFVPTNELADLQDGLPPILLSRRAMETYVRTLREPNRIELARHLLACPRALGGLLTK